MSLDPEKKIRPQVPAAKVLLPDAIAAALALEEIALVALRDPGLTAEERDILEKAVGFARSRKKRLPPSEAEPQEP